MAATSLNRAYAGLEPEFMDRVFEGTGEDWRARLAECRAHSGSGWDWFWNRFAPWGCLSTIVPGPGTRASRRLSREDVSPWLVAAVALGVLEDAEPAARLDCDGYTAWYWPLPAGLGVSAIGAFAAKTGWRPLFWPAVRLA